MNDEKNMNIDDAAELSEKELQAFMEATDRELPDLWDKISSGYQREFMAIKQSNAVTDNMDNILNNTAANTGEDKIIKFRRRKQLGFLAASVLLLTIAIPVIINTTKRSDKSEDNYINFDDKNNEKNDDKTTVAADEASGKNFAEAEEYCDDTEEAVPNDEAPTNSDEKSFLLRIDGNLVCFDEVWYIKVLAVYDNISGEAVKAGDIILVNNSKELGEHKEADYNNIMITDISVSDEAALPEDIEIPEGASIFEAETVLP